MTTTHTCDCLNDCGDDERMKTGRVTPCPHGAKRMAENRLASMGVSDQQEAKAGAAGGQQ